MRLRHPAVAALKLADVQDDWFKVYAVAPGVFAITEPRQYEAVNSFLIVGSERAILFDTGMGIARISDLVRRITTLPVTVLNSHTHFDHVGGNHEFDDVRNLDIAFSKASARGEVSDELREYASHSLEGDRVCGALPAGVTNRTYVTPTWRITSRCPRRRASRTRGPHAGSAADAGPHARFPLPARCRERPAVHRRHLLFGRGLSLGAGNRRDRLCGVHREARAPRARTQAAAAGARAAGRRTRPVARVEEGAAGYRGGRPALRDDVDGSAPVQVRALLHPDECFRSQELSPSAPRTR